MCGLIKAGFISAFIFKERLSMIIDKIENISKYKEIPEFAHTFIKNITPDIKEGRYELGEDNFANVESYLTKPHEVAKFEAHRNYIDIQLLLSGNERIYYNDVEGLVEAAPYDKSRDIVFFKDSVKKSDYLTLNGTNFALIYPHEAHAPQVSVNDYAEQVKKVVVKVKI